VIESTPVEHAASMKQHGKISTTRVQYLAIIKKLSDNITA